MLLSFRYYENINFFLTAFANPLYLNPDEMENFEESTIELPPDDGAI